MDVIGVVQFMQKTIENRRTNVTKGVENNGIKHMEQYTKLRGE